MVARWEVARSSGSKEPIVKPGPTSQPTRATLLRQRAEHSRAIAAIDEQLALLESETSTSVEYSTVRLPADCKSADQFNRACRAGRVAGARKAGRVWICSHAAWEARTPTPVPTIARAPELPTVSSSVLAELGAVARSA